MKAEIEEHNRAFIHLCIASSQAYMFCKAAKHSVILNERGCSSNLESTASLKGHISKISEGMHLRIELLTHATAYTDIYFEPCSLNSGRICWEGCMSHGNNYLDKGPWARQICKRGIHAKLGRLPRQAFPRLAIHVSWRRRWLQFPSDTVYPWQKSWICILDILQTLLMNLADCHCH